MRDEESPETLRALGLRSVSGSRQLPNCSDETMRDTGQMRGLPILRSLKRIAIFQIRLARFKFLFLRMSLSQSRGALLRDIL